MRTRRPALLLAGAALSGTVLTGCGAASFSSSADAAAPAADIVPVASDSPVEPADLSAGLLPAETFGPDATVTPLNRDTLGALPMGDVRSALADATVTPESCTSVLTTLAGAVDPAGVEGGAGQLATTDNVRIVEGLASGPAVDGALDDVAQAAAACATATVTAPQLGTATITITPISNPDLGDGAAVYRLDVSGSGSGLQVEVQALAGLVQDGDRVVGLLAARVYTGGVTSLEGTLVNDPDSFVVLLEQAYQQQADALG